MPIIDELRHHRPLHAEAARLHRVVSFAEHVNDSPVLEMHFQSAIRIAELTGAINDFVRLKGTGLPGEIVTGGYVLVAAHALSSGSAARGSAADLAAAADFNKSPLFCCAKRSASKAGVGLNHNRETFWRSRGSL